MNLINLETAKNMPISQRRSLEMSYPWFVQYEQKLLRTPNFYAIPKEQRFELINRFFLQIFEIRDFELIKTTRKKASPIARLEDVKDLFTFCRNLFSHFPYFDSWDEVHITKRLAQDLNTTKGVGKIEKFLSTSREPFQSKLVTEIPGEEFFININFPKNPGLDEIVYLKDIIDEFSAVLLASTYFKLLLFGHLEGNRYSVTFF